MAVNSVSVSRVSFNLQTLRLQGQLQANQLSLFREQQRISTGQKYLLGGENPLDAGRIVRSGDFLSQQNQLIANLRFADRFLGATEGALNDVNSLLIEAKTLALENVNSFQSDEQRSAAALVIDSLIDQLMTVGNQKLEGRYLFGGQKTQSPPLNSALGRVQFVGSADSLRSRFDFGVDGAFNVSADQIFGLGAREITGFADFNPVLTNETRLEDLSGTLGRGIRGGTIRINGGGGGSFDLDVASVHSVGELVNRFNGAAAAAAPPSPLTLSTNGDHFEIVGAATPFTVTEAGQTTAATDLGLLRNTADISNLIGGDVNPRITATTRLSDLNGGAGLVLANGIKVSNGSGATQVIDFTGATTVQDLLNKLNGSDTGIRATINSNGTGINVLNEVSGFDLTIGENGGNDATLLGIRSLHAGTTLSSLNNGRGVTVTAAGVPDLAITDAHGVSFDVDLFGAQTLQDVIDRINTAAGTAGSTLTAGLKADGNGLQLSDTAPGPTQDINVGRGPQISAASDDLGIFGSGTTELLGEDRNPQRAGGVFSALYALADALRQNDTQAISIAAAEIETASKDLTNQLGQIGARSRGIQDRLTRMEDASFATTRLLSELKEVDLTEAITKFQQVQISLQANLQTGTSLLNLSLLDFLR